MKINYNLELKDIINFNKFHLKNKSKILPATGVILMAVIIFFSFSETPITSTDMTDLFSRSIWVVIFLTLFFIFLKVGISKRVKKMNSSGDGNVFTGENSMEFSNDYLIEVHKGNERKVLYQNIYKVCENKEYLFIYDTGISCFIIPKSRIQPKIISEIKEMLQQKIINKKLHFI